MLFLFDISIGIFAKLCYNLSIRGCGIVRKKLLLLSIISATFLINLQPVFATGGGLRRASIKTCPDGVTYGLHSDGHGGTHWHRAATNGDNYYAVGDAIYSDPCPGSTGNRGTAESTNGSTNNSSNGGYSNNFSNAENSTTITPSEPQKSNDTSIEYIVINTDKISSISDEMSYETNKRNVSIEVKTKNNKATSKIDGNVNNLDSEKVNKIDIIITAEDGTTKTYILNVTRKVVESSVQIKEFKVNDSIIEFDGKKGSTFVFYSTKEFTYSYKLTDDNATITLLSKDGKEITEKNIKLNQGYNYYDILITDSDGNNNTYELEIERISNNGSILLILILIGIFCVLPIGVGIVIFLIVKKNKKRK